MKKLLGELMPNLVAGFKEKIIIENQIFKIKYNSLFSRNFKIFCNNEILIVKSDIYKNRFVFFGNDIEVFTYKSYGWFSNKLDFYEKNKLIVSI